ncbi:MAG: hypothetical protein ACI8XV_002654 [Arenicella sp.]|jgi:hypothetical protein
MPRLDIDEAVCHLDWGKGTVNESEFYGPRDLQDPFS